MKKIIRYGRAQPVGSKEKLTGNFFLHHQQYTSARNYRLQYQQQERVVSIDF